MRFLVFGIASFFLVFSSCKKEEAPIGVDLRLYGLAQNTSGFTWFANSSTFLDKSSGSGHSNPKLRTRFNEIASQMLDSNGRVLSNAQFLEGAVIVKELYDSSNKLERYAILLKEQDNEFSDAKGWVWGYIDADGKVAAPADEKGKACIGCHSQSGSIDYTLMNKYFP